MVEGLESRRLLAADVFEPNNSFNAASDLGTGSQTHTHLTIHSATDKDFFKWTASGDGTLVVDILFRHFDGDLDLKLFDSAQQLLQKSDSASDNERVVQEIVSGETYFVKVWEFNGRTSPDYTLVLTESVPDVLEPNDSSETATDLGSSDQTHTGLSIHSSSDEDYYKWTSPVDGTLAIDLLFSHAQGDVDLILFDSNGDEVASSESTTDNEHIEIAVSSGETFQIYIFGADGDVNPGYDMIIEAVAPPTISDIGFQQMYVDTPITIDFTVDDADSPLDSLTLTGTSSNPAAIPNGNIVFGGSGNNRTVTLTPIGYTDVTTITITVDDGDGGIASDDFLVLVIGTNPNQPPTISDIPNQIVDEDTPTDAIFFDVGDAETPVADLTVSAVSSDQALIPDANISFSGTGSIRAMFITPSPDRSGGPATITVTVEDGDGATASDVFGMYVNPVNDEPTLVIQGDQSALEDSGLHMVPGFASASPGGGPDEASQTFTYSVSNDNNSLFGVQPTIDSNGQLTYLSALHANGTATVTVSVTDSGGTVNGGDDTSSPQDFVITVNAVNDEPTFTAGPDQTVDEDAGPQTVVNWATGISPGPSNEAGQSLTFHVADNTNPSLFAAGPAIAADGTLTFTPADDAFGSATLTVELMDDGGTDNGGDDTSPPHTLTITVDAVNDEPTFAAGPDQTVDEDAGPQSVVNWATGITAGAPNEAAQALSFHVVSNSNPSLFATGPAIAADGTLTYTPADDANGSATLTVELMDDGGTGNGGDDTSPTQTFMITVDAVNDEPTFVTGPDQTVDEDAGPQTVIDWATGISPGPSDEAGQTLSFHVVGNTNPGLFATGPVIAADGTLTYTPADDANGDATLTVLLTDDGGTTNGGDDASPTQTFMIAVSAVNDEPTFTAGSDQTVDEDAGPQTVLNWATGISAGPPNESGQTLTFHVVTNSNPSLFASGPAIAADGTLTFTPADDAHGSATLSMELMDDGGTGNGGDDTSSTQTFMIAVDSVNDEPTFTAGSDQTVDEDAGPQTVVNWATGISAGPPNESGQTLTFHVVNNTNPSLFAAAPEIAANGTLTYTPADDAYGDATLTVELMDDGGTANGGEDTSPTQTFLIVVNAVNDNPTISEISNQFTAPDTPIGPIPITIGDVETSADLLGLSGTSADTSVIPDENIDFGGSGSSRNVTITPASGVTGVTTITVTVDDGEGGTATDQFFLVVAGSPPGPNPTITDIANQTIDEDTSTGAIPFAVDDAETAAADLAVYAVSSDPTLITDANIAIEGSGVIRTITAVPLPNRSGGPVTITVTVEDGVGNTATDTFDVIVNPVNDEPTLVISGDQNVLEDSGSQTVAAYATASPGGGPDEASQTFTYNVSNDNNALFSVQPAIDSNGQLSYTPALDANGMATVTVSVTDSGGTANGGDDTSPSQTFMITVEAVNDEPTFTAGPDQAVAEDAGPQSVNNWATGILSGPPDEAGQSLTFHVVGNTDPSLFAAGPAISPDGTLTYTPADDANGSATLTVELEDDGGTGNGGNDTSATQTFVIAVDAVNDEPGFTVGPDQTVDEDAGPQTVGNWATGISPGPSDESGQSLTFHVVANTNPSLFAAGPAIAADGTLTYTPADDANGNATLTVELMDDGGTGNGGQDTSPTQTFVVTVNPVNDEPTFSAGPDQTVDEDAGPQTVMNWATGISPGPPNESAQTLTFHVTNNTNPSLFAAGPAIAADGTLTYTPADDANGGATVTIELMDDGGTGNGGQDTSPTQTFLITVDAVNDAPTFVAGPDQTVDEDAGPQTVMNWATGISPGPPNESGQTLTFHVVNNSNPGLFATAPAIAADGTLTYNPADDANGSATVTIELMDDGGTGNGGDDVSPTQSFMITVTAVNDQPTFTAGPDQTSDEDAGPQTVINWATGISAGPPNESAQTLTFDVVSNSNPSLFATAPAIAADGTLTYTPADDANGSANLTIQLRDDGGTGNGGEDTSPTQTFMITVTAINDEPTFTAGPDQTVDEDAGPQTVVTWATGVSPGPPDESGQTLSFRIVDNTDPSLFAAGPTIDPDGTLTYTPADDANGSVIVTVELMDDGGTDNGGADTSPTQAFLITVNAVNDEPTFAGGADQTVNEDAGPQSVFGWATGISAGPPDESGQTLTFDVVGNTNPSLFVAGPAIAADGTLTYTPADDANGSATVTIELTDDGGTARNGDDTSAPHTFIIAVNAVNDEPSFTAGPKQTVDEDAGPQTVVNWATGISAGPPDESAQTLSFLIFDNSNPSLFAAGPAIAPDGTLTYTPADDANGSATLSVELKDDGGTAHSGDDTSPSRDFVITVNAVNDEPTFTVGSNQTVSEDAGPQTVTNWATGISAGPPNESGQTLTFDVVSNTNPSLFAAGPAIAADGTLTYTPADDANGSATLSVELKDDGGTEHGGDDTSPIGVFTIAISAVNDEPTFAAGPDQTVNEDAGPQTVVNWATGISAGPPDESGQTVVFHVADNTNPSLFVAGPAIAADGTLTYTPADDANGVATIAVELMDDGGTDDGGDNLSPTQSFTISVNAINDEPTFTAGPDQTVDENAGPQTVDNWATGISAGPPDEAGQTLTFHVVGNTNPGLFSAPPAIAADGTLTFTPANDANGNATIDIQLMDDGGTVGGGDDTSPTQTFVISVTAADPPVVVDVVVSGQSWKIPPFSLGVVPQAPLPWVGIDRIDVVFNKNVEVEMESLTLAGVNAPQYVPAGFEYSPGSFTATWTFALFEADKLLLNLAGEATDPHPIDDQFGSGGTLLNGGTDFELRIDVLPGDANRDGLSSVTDLVNVASRIGENAGPPPTSDYLERVDINADGLVTVTDLVNVGSRVGSSLPPGAPALPAPLMLAEGGPRDDETAVISISSADLHVLAGQAIRRLADAGLSPGESERLTRVDVQLVDLPDGQLGGASGTVIQIDINGGGAAWFVDTSPADDSEFAQHVSVTERRALEGSPAYGGVDLLTVVMHEFAHILGRDHRAASFDLMADTLATGVRRLPSAVDAMFANAGLVDQLLFDPAL